MDYLQIDNDQVEILIVDDNQANILLLESLLQHVGYTVVKAMDGLQALECVKAHHPDLILLDIMMPRMDGYETCQHLKDDPKTHEIPVIFLSAKGRREDVIKGLELGAVDYMTKPFNRVELMLRVQTQLELKLTRDKLKAMALMDGLTGLFNHSYMHERMADEISRVRRHPSPLSLIMLDLDYFKDVNDTWGHQIGDRVLEEVANIIRQYVRQEDIAGRYGGEEFMIILPETNIQDATKVAEKLRLSLEQTQWAEDGLKVTLSAGIAEWQDEEEAQIIQLADKRLYLAKNAGRNCIINQG